MIEVNMSDPNGVTLATAGKYCPENVKVTPTFPFAQNVKRWTYTLAQDSTTDVTMVVGDPWIKQNYNNPKLRVLITPSDTVGSGITRPLGATFRTNYKITEMTNGASYGMGIEASKTNNAPRGQYHRFPLTEMPRGGNTAFGPFVNSNGDIIYYNGIGSEVTLCAGNYEILAWVDLTDPVQEDIPHIILPLGEDVKYTGVGVNTGANLFHGVGYRDGYRLGSGGGESALSGVTCSGYIAVPDGASHIVFEHPTQVGLPQYVQLVDESFTLKVNSSLGGGENLQCAGRVLVFPCFGGYPNLFPQKYLRYSISDYHNTKVYFTT